MKQAVAQAIVAVLVLGVAGFFLWVIRGRRAALAAGEAALDALARELGTTYTRSPEPRIEGALAGRACLMLHLHRPGSDDHQPYVHIEIAYAGPVTLEMHRSTTGHAGIDPPDLVRTADADFDVQITVRSSDPAGVLRLLTPDRRGRLREWFRNGTLNTVWVRDGRLQIDGGFGFREAGEVARARRLLREGVEIADALQP